MRKSDIPELEVIRVYAIFAIIVVLTGYLAARLFRVQVAEGAKHEQKVSRQSIRRERLPGMRGRIFDRNGVCLAESRPSYCVAVYLEEIRGMSRGRFTVSNTVAEVLGLVDRLSAGLGMPASVSALSVSNHVQRRSPLPLLVWRDVDDRVRARMAEQASMFPAADVYVEPVRVYTNGRTAAHILGYVRRAQGPRSGEEEEEGSYQYYRPEMEGVYGMEKMADDTLRGKAGAQLIRVDASGFKRPLPTDREEDMLLPAVPGGDVMLTIDVRVQKAAEKAIEGIAGAAVVIDPRSGEILALASSPSFDPNAFSSAARGEEVNSLLGDEASPLLDRAISGVYAPGSIFKLVVVAAALEKGEGFGESTTFTCPGYYSLGRESLHCWNWQQGGHGQLDMIHGIEQSCNVYFCNLGAKCGYRAIYDTALKLGFARRTGLGLDNEKTGNLPKSSSVRSKGDLANLSVGQGAILATPLQIAELGAAIANGGRCRPPRIIKAARPAGGEEFRALPPLPVRDLNWSRSTARTIREGMRFAVHSPQGTAKRAHVEGLTMGGKTGTAEHGTEENPRKWGWTLVFAPFENPRYAVAVVVEDAVSGGVSAAPRVRQILGEIISFEDADDESG